ncbi:glycosyltransferase family 2 protein [Litoreibacter ponti]|nr:glycosyltransferase family 2 protein [Litoreibacter ponti]
MSHKASIIIPHYRDPVALRTCLIALMRCADARSTEVLVVDSGRETLTPKFKRGFPSVHFLSEPRPGAAHARNLGANKSKAKLLLFLDCDCMPHEHFISAHIAALETTDLIGGDVRVSTTPDPSGPEAFEKVFAFNQRDYIAKRRFSVTANLSTHRHVFEQVGPFHEGVSEDKDWCHRAHAQGFSLQFAPNARVTHPARQTWNDLCAKWDRLTRESYALHLAAGKGTTAWVLRSLAMPLSAVVHTVIILRSKALLDPTAKWRAIRTLFRIRLWRMAEMLRVVVRPRADRPLASETTHRSLKDPVSAQSALSSPAAASE